MATKASVRWGWLKGLYLATIVVAGGYGLGIVLVP